MNDVMKEIEKTKNIINFKFDASTNDYKEIHKNSEDDCDLFFNSFLLGYSRGLRAGKNKE